jgi:hypothetical protein
LSSPIKFFDHLLESKKPSNNNYSSDEQFDTWFLGSLMRKKNYERKYDRIALLHNRITHEDTKFDERYQANKRIAALLSEFFPKRWLLEITAIFRSIDSQKVGVKSEEDRICAYLGYIELYLAFRGLTILDSTLQEINIRLSAYITKNNVRTWKIKLLQIIPELREHWKKIRAPTHQTAIIAAVIQVMNGKEFVLTNCPKKEIFTIKHMALTIARKFTRDPKARHVKNTEVWARAICLKALRDCIPKYPCITFQNQPINVQKVIENKRRQLDRLFNQSIT